MNDHGARGVLVGSVLKGCSQEVFSHRGMVLKGCSREGSSHRGMVLKGCSDNQHIQPSHA